MGKFYYTLIILIQYFNLITVTEQSQSLRYGSRPELLHVNMDEELSGSAGRQLFPLNVNVNGNQNRFKRDTSATNTKLTKDDPVNYNNQNITTVINPIKDSHSQLMVHWLGDGTDIMICLARDPPPGPQEDKKKIVLNSSSVYISYDYGTKFIDKTQLFTVTINGTERNSTIDQFTTHPNFSTVIFTDSLNKAIFTNNDMAQTFLRYMVDFTPSDVSFYEKDSRTFLVLDKEDPERKLYYTIDFGQSFTLLDSNVKSFIWSSGDGMPIHLYVERREPTNTSSIVFINASQLLNAAPVKFNLLIENVQDFHIKKDFMFATRRVLNNTQLFISYKRGKFVKADFQTELEIKGLHIADVENKRIMASAVHTEYSTHLYVSESNDDMTEIKFVPSLENIFTYIPELTWRSSWLVQSSDEAFTDLYKVEGLRGIYVASKIYRSMFGSKLYGTITPDHLGSLITFDHGSTWKPIQAPTVDDEGQLINCTKDCSLHLSQKFGQLYPASRAVSILSSKSAPGVIMASGVVGKSLKGRPNIFISRDAGQTWKQILKGFYFFNFGDHGGVLVAAKYYKQNGETREILYSVDEGETWIPHMFHSSDLKVYGLMTEPKTNSTIFTLFGSELKEHRWLIIKIDLRNAFEYNCTADDYKFWSPGSQTGDSILPCVLGYQETYQRRAAHSKCYNGKDYNRPIRTEVCMCSSWDFECDFGFSRINRNAPCVRNKTEKYNPYDIPAYCPPGTFYNRTKGYRLIEGDGCVDGFASQYLPQSIPCPMDTSSDFLIVAQRDKVSLIDIPSGRKGVLPIKGLKNVIAVDYDLKHNCVFWADILTDQIGRQCFNGNQSAEILLESELASVEGMSYDWISELLFFVDGSRLKIEALRTAKDITGKSKIRKTIIDSNNLSKPRGIVVHPIEGYLFWTDWSQSKPSISRANLDGSDIRVLFTKPQVIWPNGITIDYIAERVYWVDASRDYIGSSDLNGKSFKKILEQDSRVAHPFAVGVYKDHMYWDDWKMNSVFLGDKDHGIMIQVLAKNMTSLMDLKVYGHSIQSGKNKCSEPNNCSHICVGAPQKSFTCLCSDGMKLSANGECLCPGLLQPYPNNTCPKVENTCAPGFFACKRKDCVPALFRCDGENDCGDRSDEENCPHTKQPCQPHMFTCLSDSKCVPEYFKCDHDKDCIDGSDELECHYEKCKLTEFTCGNGRCISQKWVCDGEDDCRDNSDESNCTQSTKSPHSCKPNELACKSTGHCFSANWKCDGERDCIDGTDEEGCEKQTCGPWMFECAVGNKCIQKSWVCDNEKDCEDGSDEKNCNFTTPPPRYDPAFIAPVCHDWMFKCANTKCVPYWWKCDGINDCGDHSDEFGCNSTDSGTGISTTVSTTPITDIICPRNNFMCNSGTCISKPYVCDGVPDCSEGEDERNCPKVICGRGKFRCRSDGMCLAADKYCDGKPDCDDHSDEDSCPKGDDSTEESSFVCPDGFFRCNIVLCLPQSRMCDGKTDCYDGFDEENCSNTTNRAYQVEFIAAFKPTLNATSFLISWLLPAVRGETNFEFLPSISMTGTDNWHNHTKWIEGTDHRFTNLIPYTNYNVTVYARLKGTDHASPPFLYTNQTTDEGVPSAPLNVNATQLNGSRVQVSWDPPKEPYGILKEYTVYYDNINVRTKNVPTPNAVNVNAPEKSVIIESYFSGNQTYGFWVKAKNSRHESPSSKVVQLTFNDLSNIDQLYGLMFSNIGPDFIELKWREIKNVDGYSVVLIAPEGYPKFEPVHTTKEPKIKLGVLVKGVHVTVKVSAYIGQYYGRPSSIMVTLPGEPLPEVPGLSLSQDGNLVKLKWGVPNTKLPNITYGVYYGTTMDELLEKPRINTQNRYVDVKGLRPCQVYMISVAINNPNDKGPLTRSPLRLETEYNEDSPPKNLKIDINADEHEMILSWEHNCPLSNQHPSYIVNVNELTLNTTSTFELRTTSDKVVTHKFRGILKGSVFNVSVSTNSKQAEPIVLKVYAPPLPSPRQLMVYEEINGKYVVHWKEVSFDESSFLYEVVVLPGTGINETLNPVYITRTKKPPAYIFSTDLGGIQEAGKLFTVGVRIKSEEGYYSPIRETEHILLGEEAWLAQSLSSSSSPWFLILTIIGLLIIMSTLVAIFVMRRNRRMATTFSRFGNSHYDPRTGSTRIGDSYEDDDHNHHNNDIHQDVPRFDDDEPLVIT